LVYVTIMGLAAGKGVPSTSHVRESVSVKGAVAQLLAATDRVKVKGVAVRRSLRPGIVY